MASIDECAAVILELGGTLSVYPRAPTTSELVTREIVDRLGRIERLLMSLHSTS